MLEFLRILSEHEDDKMVQFLWMNFDFNLYYSEQHHSLKMSTTQAFRNKIKYVDVSTSKSGPESHGKFFWLLQN